MALVNIGSETEQIEYKKSVGELKEAMISIAAILNKHRKGELYFGVKNDGTVIGQEINEESLRKVSQAIGNHIRPIIYPEIKIQQFGGRKTILVRFEGSRCPYLAYNVPRIRVADEDLVMEQGIYDAMMRKRDNIEYSWEKRVSKHTIDDVNEDAFSEYLRKAKEAGRIDFEDTDVKTVLDKLELTEGNYLLNAGAALFCDCGIINELQIAKFASDERLTFTDIRRYSGSIMELKKKAEQYMIDVMDWRVEFGNMTRKEIPEIPLDAIREAITNSFGHRMFDSGQSNEITIFKNRIEIYNPGAFPTNKTPESYVIGNQRPIRRNPLITRTLYYSKDMESFATGLKRIKDACDKAGCRVEFEMPDDGFVVVFYRHGIQKLSGTAQKTAQKREKTAQKTAQKREKTAQKIAQKTAQKEEKTAQKIVQKKERINALLEYCKEPRDRDEMMTFLGIKHRTTFRSDYLTPLLNEGKITMTMPDKPRSKNQKFYSV